MQNFLKVDDRRAQRLLRNSARSSVVVPLCGAQEMSEQGASAAHEYNLRFEYAERYTFSSALGSVSCIMRPTEMVCRSMMRLAPLVVWRLLLRAPIRPDAQTTPPTARPLEDVSHRAVNAVGRIEVAATQYFCSLAPQFLENSNGDCASSMTI